MCVWCALGCAERTTRTNDIRCVYALHVSVCREVFDEFGVRSAFASIWERNQTEENYFLQLRPVGWNKLYYSESKMLSETAKSVIYESKKRVTQIEIATDCRSKSVNALWQCHCKLCEKSSIRWVVEVGSLVCRRICIKRQRIEIRVTTVYSMSHPKGASQFQESFVCGRVRSSANENIELRCKLAKWPRGWKTRSNYHLLFKRPIASKFFINFLIFVLPINKSILNTKKLGWIISRKMMKIA